VTCIVRNWATPPNSDRNAVSAASRPEQIRTNELVGASRVGSTTHHVPSTSASTTAWKSIGESPGA
jgi:hypothetical protein